MGHDPDPAAEAAQLRGLIRDAHAALKDLRAAMREARQLGPALVAEFQALATAEIQDVANHMQEQSNLRARELNAAVDAARVEIANRLFDARIVHDPVADNFKIVIPGASFDDHVPMPYPERMPPP